MDSSSENYKGTKETHIKGGRGRYLIKVLHIKSKGVKIYI